MSEKIAVLRDLHAQASELVSEVRGIAGLAGAQEAARLEWLEREQAQLDVFSEFIQKLANGTCTSTDWLRYAAALNAMAAEAMLRSADHKISVAH